MRDGCIEITGHFHENTLLALNALLNSFVSIYVCKILILSLTESAQEKRLRGCVEMHFYRKRIFSVLHQCI